MGDPIKEIVSTVLVGIVRGKNNLEEEYNNKCTSDRASTNDCIKLSTTIAKLGEASNALRQILSGAGLQSKQPLQPPTVKIEAPQQVAKDVCPPAWRNAHIGVCYDSWGGSGTCLQDGNGYYIGGADSANKYERYCLK